MERINFKKGQISLPFNFDKRNPHYDNDNPYGFNDGSVAPPTYQTIFYDQKKRWPHLFILYNFLRKIKSGIQGPSKKKANKLIEIINNTLTESDLSTKEAIAEIKEKGTEAVFPYTANQLVDADYLELIQHLDPNLVNAMYNNLSKTTIKKIITKPAENIQTSPEPTGIKYTSPFKRKF